MNRMVASASMLIALLVSSSALADSKCRDDVRSFQPDRADAEMTNQIEGQVDEVDLARGRLVIAAQGHRYLIHALPNQLLGIQPGATLTVPYTMMRGSAWVPTKIGGGMRELQDQLGGKHQRVGVISQIDHREGLVTIGNEQFHAHPKLLRHVEVGDTVAAQFVPVQSSRWVVDVRSHGPHAMGEVGAGQAEDLCPCGGAMGPGQMNEGPMPSPGYQPRWQAQPEPQPEAQAQPEPEPQPQPPRPQIGPDLDEQIDELSDERTPEPPSIAPDVDDQGEVDDLD